MKWPLLLTTVRHGESAFNEVQHARKNDPLWKKFLQEFARAPHSAQTRELAELIMRRYPLPYSDYDTPLNSAGKKQAQEVGRYLKTHMPLPDVIIVSPYLRCRETFVEMKKSWRALGNAKFYIDSLIKEREIGHGILYNNWRIFYAFHPEEYKLNQRVGYYWYRYPAGENIDDMIRRIRQWLGTITREFAGKIVLVVTHHLTILGLRAALERMSPEEFMKLDKKAPPQNCSYTIYRGHPKLGESGKLILEAYNKIVPAGFGQHKNKRFKKTA